MCMFTGEEEVRVSDTKILSSDLGGGKRGLVYQMKTSFENPTAMVLPVPVKKGTDVKFLDFSSYDNFFEDLNKLFPEPVSRSKGRSMNLSFDSFSLEVVKVGAYVASFVPTRADFARLDERFQLDKEIFEQLPYGEFAFVVAQLDPAESGKKIHPMGFSYEISNDDYLFIPTVHVHDGDLEQYGDFDHDIYVGTKANLGGEASSASVHPYGSKVDLERSHGLIQESMKLSKIKLKGSLKNGDILVKGNTCDLNFFSKQGVDKIFYR